MRWPGSWPGAGPGAGPEPTPALAPITGGTLADVAAPAGPAPGAAALPDYDR